MFWMSHAFCWVSDRCLNVICQHFRTLCLFHLDRWVGMKCDWGWHCWGVCMGKRFGSKIVWANQKEGDREGAVPSRKQAVEGNDPRRGHRYGRHCVEVRSGSRGMADRTVCLRWLSAFLNLGGAGCGLFVGVQLQCLCVCVLSQHSWFSST
jgi:hypothetical protein